MIHLFLVIISLIHFTNARKENDYEYFGPRTGEEDEMQTYNQEKFETLFKSYKETDPMEQIDKLSKLDPKQRTTKKGESKEEESINSTTLPELLLLIFLGVFVCLLVCLVCIGSKSCVERFLAGRQRLKKALQYRPGKYRTRVTPIPAVEQAGNEEYAMGNIFQIS